ncbi:MAG: T9SS type A sorting domain-containing protein [Saprospiraceae bacterium]|nr:T9SS type A sorting domain-containing protein [Saprospiraceae bacterium]
MAQSCPPVQNFGFLYYDIYQADYEWDYAADAKYYILRVEINGKAYKTYELPGQATKTSVPFDPKLVNYDLVSAKLTKVCSSGGNITESADFVIITDGIVYLDGGTHGNEPRVVEPVVAVNDNLVPVNQICGLCDPGFFRLENGFYAPYGIYSSAYAYPIENLRFRKDDLCNCLDAAISAGVLAPSGGPGPNYSGAPFNCKIDAYIFEEKDCTREEKPGERSIAAADPTADLLEVIPNPITGTARIQYNLRQETNTSLTLIDLTGRAAKQLLINKTETAGEHQVDFDVFDLEPGLYFCRLQAGELVQTQKIIIAR